MKKYWGAVLGIAMLLLQTTTAYAVGALAPVRCDRNFLAPAGLMLGEEGALLVSDGGLNNLVSIQNGVSRIEAGKTLPYDATGRPAGGHLDGVAEQALFSAPCAMAPWGDGVAVSDRDNHSLRLLSDGIVRTLAGDGQEGYRDGAAAQARFSAPLGLALGDNGTLYIADSGNGCIRMLDAHGAVSTYLSGLSEPAGLCWYGGALYVTDVGSHRVLRVENGKATVLAGRAAQADGTFSGGFSDGPAALAAFSAPFAITVREGTVYVADTGNSAIRQLRNGWVSTLACYRGSAEDLWPGRPVGLQAQGEVLFVADAFAGLVLQLDTRKQLFQDVSTQDWCAEGISYAYTSALMQGVSKTEFSPLALLTRGQAAVLLHRLEGQPTPHTAAFIDVPTTLYCAEAVNWAAECGLLEGTAPGIFSPDDPITREQLITLLYRYAGAKGDARPQGTALAGYVDADEISDPAVVPMKWACAQRIVRGTAHNKLAPHAAVERGQAAVFLTRLRTAGSGDKPPGTT